MYLTRTPSMSPLSTVSLKNSLRLGCLLSRQPLQVWNSTLLTSEVAVCCSSAATKVTAKSRNAETRTPTRVIPFPCSETHQIEGGKK